MISRQADQEQWAFVGTMECERQRRPLGSDPLNS